MLCYRAANRYLHKYRYILEIHTEYRVHIKLYHIVSFECGRQCFVIKLQTYVFQDIYINTDILEIHTEYRVQINLYHIVSFECGRDALLQSSPPQSFSCRKLPCYRHDYHTNTIQTLCKYAYKYKYKYKNKCGCEY